jgi:TonB family protein
MKRHLLSAALLFAPLLHASTQAAQQILATAEQQAHIFADNGAPVQLEVDFTAQMNVPIHGHLSLRWQSKDRWWSKVVLGDFQQTTLQNGDKLYTSRNRPAPLRVAELTRLLHFAHAPGDLVVKSDKQRVQNGVTLTCLQLEWARVKSESHEVCVNPASRDIVSDAWQGRPTEQSRELFTDYVAFGGHRYPRRLQLEVNGSKVITATIDSLKEAALDQSLLAPPKGAIERRQCAGMKHAVPLSTPSPSYPNHAQNGLTGDTMVAMTVLTDGSVRDIEPIGAGARSLDNVTLATLKTWKFKPALCGSDPVISDVQVVVSFRPQK